MRLSLAPLFVAAAFVLAPSLSFASQSRHPESFASAPLARDPQWPAGLEPGSFEALAAEQAAHGRDWNPEAWNGDRAWDGIPDDGDLGRLIHGGDDGGHGNLGICGVVPEPSSALMLALGTAALAALRIPRSWRRIFRARAQMRY